MRSDIPGDINTNGRLAPGTTCIGRSLRLDHLNKLEALLLAMTENKRQDETIFRQSDSDI
jgi:hypothetical protein